MVFVETAYGTVVREAPARGGAKSALQQAGERRLAAASRAFGALSREEGQAWAAYGATLAEPHPKTGRVVGLSGQQAFNRLASKRLQIDPHAALPKAPPTAPFFGDGLRATVEAVPGGVRFAADAPNREGILTELLLQPLASAHRRTYAERYRTRAFAAFAQGALTTTVPCPNGWTAAAVRFVEAATGRATALVELGVVQAI